MTGIRIKTSNVPPYKLSFIFKLTAVNILHFLYMGHTYFYTVYFI